MKAKEIRDLPADEIRSEIEKAREKLFRMRFQAKGKDVENPGMLKALKKDIARMNTVLRQRQLARLAKAETANAEVAATTAAPDASEPPPVQQA